MYRKETNFLFLPNLVRNFKLRASSPLAFFSLLLSCSSGINSNQKYFSRIKVFIKYKISSVGIDRVCKIVTIREEDEIRRLYRLLDLFDFNTDGLESRYLRTVEKLRNTGDSAEYRTARYMLWQMCNGMIQILKNNTIL